jgi:hypothetical protein
MALSEELAGRLMRWWCERDQDDFISQLTEDFEYDDGLGLVNHEDFAGSWEIFGKIKDYRCVSLVLGDSITALMFEGTDTVTDLRHRISLHVSFRGERIRRIVKTSGTIPGLQDGLGGQAGLAKRETP